MFVTFNIIRLFWIRHFFLHEPDDKVVYTKTGFIFIYLLLLLFFFLQMQN
jgi:hypothetical protein